MYSADMTIAEEEGTSLPTGECITQNQIIEEEINHVCCITEPIMKLEDYSSLNKLLRVTAWVKRFVRNFHSAEKQQGELCEHEIENAEKYWIRLTQLKSFPNEMKHLETKRGIGQNIKSSHFEALFG